MNRKNHFYFIALLMFIISGCKCFNKICDECRPDVYAGTTIVHFNAGTGQYTTDEIDTLLLQTITISSADTANTLLISYNGSNRDLTLKKLGLTSAVSNPAYIYNITLKDGSKTIRIENIRLLFDRENEDACCDCDKWLFNGAKVNGVETGNGGNFEISK
ncbi:MAG: hypothetical protein IPI23_17010 [Bacteroidetes bacterium]|nr:hypothetical protein [Bacteroidota bacterium]